MALAFLNSNAQEFTGTTPATITYTNTAACVMVMEINTFGAGSFVGISGVTDSAGITWTRRKRVQYVSKFVANGTVDHITQEVWWANITGTHGSNVTVSVALTNTAALAGHTQMLWGSYTGSLSPSAPWDVNATLPGVATFSDPSATSAPSAPWNITSTSACELNFVTALCPNGSNLGSPGTGYTAATSLNGNATSTNFLSSGIAQKLLQTGSGTATWANAQDAWILTADALTGTATGTAAEATLAIVNASTSNPGAGSPITTTYTNAAPCVMILAIETRGVNTGGGYVPVTSITDSAGVTWTRRNQVKYLSAFSGLSGSYSHVVREIWWANITAAHASAVTITINLLDSANETSGTVINQFQVTGSLVPATPWDINAALPTKGTFSSASGGTSTPTANWTVSSSEALVLAVLQEMGATGSASASTVGSGYTLTTDAVTGTSTTGIAHAGVESKLLSASGSGTATWVAPSNIREWVLITDALTSDTNGTAADATPSYGPIALRSSGTGGSTSGGALSAVLPSALANDYILAFVAYGVTSGTTPATVSSISGGGLTWTKIQSITNGGNAASQEVWVASVPSSTLTNTTFTVTSAGAAQDAATMYVASFSGVDTDTPLEIFSARGTSSGGTTQPSLSGFTPSATGMLVGAASGVNGAMTAAGTGFTDVGSKVQAGALKDSAIRVETQTGTGGTSLTFAGTYNVWVAQGVVLEAAPTVTTTTGTITQALTKLSQSSSGNVSSGPALTGTIATHLTKASISGTIATEKFLGTIQSSLAKISQASAGNVSGGPHGTIQSSLAKISQASAGNVSGGPHGTITTALSKIGQSAVGPSNVSGSVTTTLRGANLSATAKEIFVGAAVTNIDTNAAFALHALTFEVFSGHIITNLSPMNFAQSLVGEERVIGSAVTKLGDATGKITANVVQAEVIILGPIEMALPPFRPVLLGAKLGSPGAGKWYSWRYTDA